MLETRYNIYAELVSKTKLTILSVTAMQDEKLSSRCYVQAIPLVEFRAFLTRWLVQRIW